MNIEKLIKEIIPPRDYEHRNGFNNIPLIDKLNDDEKRQLEDALINKLLFESDYEIDTLIVETLAYLKSEKSLPILKDLLKKAEYDIVKLKIASSIFEISHDNAMIDIAVECFNGLENNNGPYYKYGLISAFYYLIKFKSIRLNRIIEKYTNHEEDLIAYNAKQALRNGENENY